MNARGATLAHHPSSSMDQPAADRLADLVAHLSGYSPRSAETAVRAAATSGRPQDDDERLEVVARALVAIRRARRRTLRSLAS